MTDNYDPIYDAVLDILNQHIGSKAAINQNLLLRELHNSCPQARTLVSSARELLHIIHDLRNARHVIGSCSRGYFIPADVDEAKEYIARVLVSRRNDLSETINAQLQAAVNKYGQQIEMPL